MLKLCIILIAIIFTSKLFLIANINIPHIRDCVIAEHYWKLFVIYIYSIWFVWCWCLFLGHGLYHWDIDLNSKKLDIANNLELWVVCNRILLPQLKKDLTPPTEKNKEIGIDYNLPIPEQIDMKRQKPKLCLSVELEDDDTCWRSTGTTAGIK